MRSPTRRAASRWRTSSSSAGTPTTCARSANSMLLGLGHRGLHTVLGFAIALLLVRFDFRGRDLFGYLTLIPDHLAAAGRRARLHLHHGAGRHGERAAPRLVRRGPADQLRLRPARRAAGGDAAPVPDDHPQRGRRAGQDRSLAGGGGRERGGPRLDEAAHDHAAADDAGVRGRRAAGLHLDLLGLRHAAGAGRPRPAGRPGLSQHRAVRRSPAVPHGHRHLGADGGPGRASSWSPPVATWPSRTTRRCPIHGSPAGACRGWRRPPRSAFCRW